MSLYAVQKVIYEVNRNPQSMAAFRADSAQFLASYSLNMTAHLYSDCGFL